MNKFTTTLVSACLAIAANGAMAANTPGDKPMDNAMPMTMEQCKDHMAMSKNSTMKKDDAMMKKDMVCEDMMKKDMMKKDSMKKDSMKKDKEPAKK